jgi:hypothetical protein
MSSGCKSQPAREPAPAYRGDGEHALWHVSEDASLGVLEPHRARTAVSDDLLVWAVDTRHLPLFWFPRACPRATFWAAGTTRDEDVERFLDGRRDRRVHAIEGGWLGRMSSARVLGYRLPEATFRPHPAVGGYWISRAEVEPSEVVALGDLLARHAEAMIELRIVPNLWPVWDAVVGSTLEFSGIRLRDAQPPPRAEPVTGRA